ncbi:hypothetical protein [Pontibacter liquoris]|uniref:hypothetical protein n=1 Tax=Pontibacter liquoris TaxID=2905677 RepID=UPI001FA79643|nr:hypothetical protein [Pontibacter liquoris]
MIKSKLQQINQFGKQCKTEIDVILTNKGYEVTQEEHHPESFESRYWVWINYKTKHCYRFVWDGKNEWFSLEESHFINNPEKVGWADVIVVDFEGQVSNSDNWEEIIKDITVEIK